MNTNTVANKTHIDLILAIQDDIRIQVLPFKAIAIKHNVSISTVHLVWLEMCENN